MDDTAKREKARREVLAYLDRQPDWLLDIVKLFAHAMERDYPYVLCVAAPPAGTVMASNFEDDLKRARFLERFARAARKDAPL